MRSLKLIPVKKHNNLPVPPKMVFDLKHNIGLVEFSKHFSEQDICMKFIENIKWKNGSYCPRCQTSNPYPLGIKGHLKTDYGRYQCRSCRLHFNIMRDTMFQGSRMPLAVWFYLIYCYALNKKNMASMQVAKNLGISQKTAWHAMKHIRKLFADEFTKKLSGVIEIDEAFLSKHKAKHKIRWGSLSTRKEPILGMVERGGRAIIIKIDSRTASYLEPVIRPYVEEGSTVYTDAWSGYNGLKKFYNHEFVNHSNREYVRGVTHTNNVENLWRTLKNSIRGACHSVSDKHVQAYCDEITFRVNRRHWTPLQIFQELLNRAIVHKKEKNEIISINL